MTEVVLLSAEKVEYAKKLVAAHEEGRARGLGTVGVDGVLVDWPVYIWAKNRLEQAGLV